VSASVTHVPDFPAVPPIAPPTTAPLTSDATADRQFQRQAITEHFLTALEDVVWRYRAMSGHPEHADLYAEVVTAEVAHQLAVARGALHRHPSVG
jgi:hypothetical protein